MSYQEDRFLAIAEAIRTKKGTSAPIVANNFSTEILSIPTGGVVDVPVKKDINFYDYDGTLVAGYAFSDLPLSSLPSTPNHSSDDIPLTFIEWTRTLEEVNVANQKVDVGATYNPTDGKTHIVCRVTIKTGLKPTLSLNNTGGEALTVYWGDGQTSTATGTGVKTFTPTNNLPVGNTDFTIESTGTYAFPTLTASMYFLGSVTYNQMVRKVVLSAHVTALGAYSFNDCSSLTSISMANGLLSVGTYAFYACDSLRNIVFPNSITSILTYVFRNSYGLNKVILPKGITSINSNGFYSTSVECLTVPSNITNVSANGMSGSDSLSDIYFDTLTPPTIADVNVFGLNASLLLHVPAAALAAYKAKTNWVTLANQIVDY